MNYISAIPRRDAPPPRQRQVAVLGSTGSIGRNALDVMGRRPDLFQVKALAGGENVELLAQQAAVFRPDLLAVRDKERQGTSLAHTLRGLLPYDYRPEIVSGPEGYARMASLSSVDTVLSAQVGAAGLRATVAAAAAGKIICLANKESLVLAGPLLRGLCASTGAVILPVDSEHYAIFQCIAEKHPATIERIILTASGGPFRGRSREELQGVAPEDALAHPNWTMGAKITIDSATLMNKGLEVIEACQLYDLPPERIQVLLHPQSIVHSLVQFRDASVLAQLAMPDMRLPIAACMMWPRMLEMDDVGIAPLNLTRTGALNFADPDTETFPCLTLAIRALQEGRTVELNAANEVAVRRFLNKEIGFLDIPRLVSAMLDEAQSLPPAVPWASDPQWHLAYCDEAEVILARIEERDALTRNRAAQWRA